MQTKRKFKAISISLCLVMVFSFTMPVAAESAPASADTQTSGVEVASGPVFTDLPADKELYPYVRYLTDKGILSGFSDGSFRPDGTLTRAEAAKMVALAKGLTPSSVGVQAFSDVPTGYWAYGMIQAAVKTGLLKGYGDGTFRPNASITRAEAAAILMQLSGGTLTDESMAIPDLTSSHWTYRQAATAVQAGLMELSSDGKFNPKEKFQRGEMAKGIAVLFGIGPALRSAELIGKLTVTSGTVTVNDIKIEKTETVGVGDTIITGSNSKAEIVYDDGSGFLIDPNTELSITASKGLNYMKHNGVAGVTVDKLTASLKKGTIFGALANHYNNTTESAVTTGALTASEGSGGDKTDWWDEPYKVRTRVEIHMPGGVTEIKGTFWNNTVNSNGGSTSVMDGSVTVTSSSGGQSVSVSAGQVTSLSWAGAPPSPPAPMPPVVVTAWATAATWAMQCANAIQSNPPMPMPQNPLGMGPPNVVSQVTAALNQLTGGPQDSGSGGGGSHHHSTVPVPSQTANPYASRVSGITLSSDDCVIELFSDTSGATIYYTTDGTAPTTASSIFAGSIVLEEPTTVSAIAVSQTLSQSDVASFFYYYRLATPVQPTISIGNEKKATWISVSNASEYLVKLYKNSTQLTSVTASGISVESPDLSSAMTAPGDYTVTVTAKGSGGYVDSYESTPSAIYTVPSD